MTASYLQQVDKDGKEKKNSMKDLSKFNLFIYYVSHESFMFFIHVIKERWKERMK